MAHEGGNFLQPCLGSNTLIPALQKPTTFAGQGHAGVRHNLSDRRRDWPRQDRSPSAVLGLTFGVDEAHFSACSGHKLNPHAARRRQACGCPRADLDVFSDTDVSGASRRNWATISRCQVTFIANRWHVRHPVRGRLRAYRGANNAGSTSFCGSPADCEPPTKPSPSHERHRRSAADERNLLRPARNQHGGSNNTQKTGRRCYVGLSGSPTHVRKRLRRLGCSCRAILARNAASTRPHNITNPEFDGASVF